MIAAVSQVKNVKNLPFDQRLSAMQRGSNAMNYGGKIINWNHSELIQMLESADKDMRIVIVFYVFKQASTDVEDTEQTQTELQYMKVTMSDMKNTMVGLG